MGKRDDLLFGGDWVLLSGPASTRRGLPSFRGAGAGGREAVARWAMGGSVASWALAVVMRNALRRQIAFVHALCAVFARRAAIFIDTLGLAFAASHAGTSGPEGGRANSASRHWASRARMSTEGTDLLP